MILMIFFSSSSERFLYLYRVFLHLLSFSSSERFLYFSCAFLKLFTKFFYLSYFFLLYRRKIIIFCMNNFCLSYILNQLILLIENILRIFLSYFMIIKICFDFSIIRFCFSFYIFLVVYKVSIKFFCFNTIFDSPLPEFVIKLVIIMLLYYLPKKRTLIS